MKSIEQKTSSGKELKNILLYFQTFRQLRLLQWSEIRLQNQTLLMQNMQR